MIQPVEPHQWYVVYSKPQKEKYAKFHLGLKGLEVFFPQLFLPESLQQRKQIVPLFPNYLFVRMRFSQEYNYVLWSPGVKRVVSFDGTPHPIDEKIVNFLMQQATPEGIIKARSSLMVGQEIRISGGSFDGVVGIIQEPPNARERVTVLLKLLNREVSVDLPLRVIKSGWVIKGQPTRRGNIGLNPLPCDS